jgi:excisionase family DNA binding protein
MGVDPARALSSAPGGGEHSASASAADRLLTAADVAELLAVPERWVREHTRGGLLPHVRLGRYVRYRHEAVARWLDEHERAGAAWRTYHPRDPGTR